MEYKFKSRAQKRERKKGQANWFHLGFVSKPSHSNEGDSESQTVDAVALLLLEEKANEEDCAEREEMQ